MVNLDLRCLYCNWLNKEVLVPFICRNCKKENGEHEKEIVEEDWLVKLNKISGIGKETIADIKRIYSSLDELKIALVNDTTPLRNDIVKKLKSYII